MITYGAGESWFAGGIPSSCRRLIGHMYGFLDLRKLVDWSQLYVPNSAQSWWPLIDQSNQSE